MALMAQHLSVEELEARFRASKDVVERSHCQAIWLLAKGHTTAEVAEVVALSSRLGCGSCRSATHGRGRRRWATADGAIPAAGHCCRRMISTCFASGWIAHRTTAGCGPGRRWRGGWRRGSGSSTFTPRVAGRR